MIQLLDLHTSNTVGLKISGKIEKTDMDTLIQAFQERFAQSDKVRVYVEVESMGGISLDALVLDLKFSLVNFRRFEKKAVVSPQEWLGKLADVGDRLFPSLEVHHYTPDQREEAIAWVTH